jgi:hypothetical protein
MTMRSLAWLLTVPLSLAGIACDTTLHTCGNGDVSCSGGVCSVPFGGCYVPEDAGLGPFEDCNQCTLEDVLYSNCLGTCCSSNVDETRRFDQGRPDGGCFASCGSSCSQACQTCASMVLDAGSCAKTLLGICL